MRAATLSAAASRHISPHLELCWRTHNKHLARAAVLGWAGLVLGSFTYKRSIWSFIKAGTRTRLASRLTLGPASPDAAAGTRLHREPHLFLFSQVSVKFYHHGGPADDVTSWPAVAAAPSCSSGDVMMMTPAGHCPSPAWLGRDLALVTTLGHCSCSTEDWAGLGSDHTTSSL